MTNLTNYNYEFLTRSVRSASNKFCLHEIATRRKQNSHHLKAYFGWLDWKDNKPLRFPFKNKPEPVDASKPVRHFWAMAIYDYKDKQVKILEITQATIQKAIETYAKDQDWGSPTDYDLKINKTGQDKNTEYSVVASPKKPVNDEIKQAAKDRPMCLETLFKGGDPFTINNGEQTQYFLNDLPF